jgi:hypothetical protein
MFFSYPIFSWCWALAGFKPWISGSMVKCSTTVLEPLALLKVSLTWRHDFQLNGSQLNDIQQYNKTIDALPFSEAVNTWILTSSSGCRWPWQWFLPPWSPPTQRQRTLWEQRHCKAFRTIDRLAILFSQFSMIISFFSSSIKID